MSELIYRPSLEYDKDYSTTGSPVTDQQTVQQDEAINSNIPASPAPSISNIARLLPDDIYNLIQKQVSVIEEVFNSIKEEDVASGPIDKEIKVKPVVNIDRPEIPDIIFKDVISIEDLPDAPPLFANITPIEIDIVKVDPVEKAIQDYKLDLHAILYDYMDRFNNTVSNYYMNMNAILAEAKLSSLSVLSKPYTGKTADIKSDDMKHVSDSLIRSQIVRGQKMRLYKKMYDTNEVMMHIRSTRVAADLKVRYLKSNMIENAEGFLDMSSNIMLAGSRQAYDKKYKENLTNLYKYLNSSVILINECLYMYIEEAKAKSILINREGISI